MSRILLQASRKPKTVQSPSCERLKSGRTKEIPQLPYPWPIVASIFYKATAGGAPPGFATTGFEPVEAVGE